MPAMQKTSRGCQPCRKHQGDATLPPMYKRRPKPEKPPKKIKPKKQSMAKALYFIDSPCGLYSKKISIIPRNWSKGMITLSQLLIIYNTEEKTSKPKHRPLHHIKISTISLPPNKPHHAKHNQNPELPSSSTHSGRSHS